MGSEQGDKGWVLHSGGRRFGPLSEDEVRHYFRAGMVKSVDRLVAPGAYVMQAAGEVAAALGETPPAGPPPPPIEDAPAPMPATGPVHRADAPPPADPERAARAIAAMQLQMAMAGRDDKEKSPGWLLPLIIVAALVASLFFGLHMLKKMSSNPSPAVAAAQQNGFGDVQERIASDPRLAPPPADSASPGASETMAPRAVEAAPVNSGVAERNQKANDLLRASDWSGLAAYAKSWADEQPERNEPWQFLGVAYARLGDYAKSADALNKVLQRDPTHLQARSLLAETYLEGKHYPEAVNLYKQLVAADSGNAHVWNNYGYALSQVGQTPQAIAALETAVKLDPSFKDAWMNLGNAYQSLGDPARASAAFANAR